MRPRRSPARYLAPLALAATIAGTYAVVHHGLARPANDKHPRRQVESRRPRRGSPARTSPTTGARYYVVRAGDTLDAIAARSHISLRTLEALNPSVSATSLRVGQRLALSR